MKKLIAAGSICLVAGVAAAPAYAHTGSPNTTVKGHAKVSFSPKSGVKTGTKISLTGKKGLKKTAYSCVETITHNGTADASTTNLSSIVNTKSNKKGAFKCSETFKPYGPYLSGTTSVSCPPSKKLAKKGYSCALAYFDTGTSGKKSDGYVNFKAKK